jgi:hypothetical protein
VLHAFQFLAQAGVGLQLAFGLTVVHLGQGARQQIETVGDVSGHPGPAAAGPRLHAPGSQIAHGFRKVALRLSRPPQSRTAQRQHRQAGQGVGQRAAPAERPAQQQPAAAGGQRQGQCCRAMKHPSPFAVAVKHGVGL